MPEIDWYYAKGQEQFGPVGTSELKAMAEAGRLTPDDLVWREGLSQWTPSSRVRGLHSGQTGSSPDISAGQRARSLGAVDAPPMAGTDFGGGARREVRAAPFFYLLQGALWLCCAATVVVAGISFLLALSRAEGGQEQAGAAAVFVAFTAAAYVIARSAEKLTDLAISFLTARADRPSQGD
jgi:hypothetical protein